MNIREACAALSIALSFGTTLLYLHMMFRKGTKPHAFSWIIGCVLSSITCTIQFTHHGGPGAWLQAWNALSAGGVALLAVRRGDTGYTRSDWLALAFSLGSIPLWLATGTPLWSVLLLCVIDGAGIYPTYRKSWHAPHEEPALPWLLWSVSAVISVAALDRIDFINAGYPLFFSAMNLGLITLLILRRRVWNR